MTQHVSKGLPAYGDPQLGSPGEIRLYCFARSMLLGEEDLPIRPFTGSPLFHPTLKRVKLPQVVSACTLGH